MAIAYFQYDIVFTPAGERFFAKPAWANEGIEHQTLQQEINSRRLAENFSLSQFPLESDARGHYHGDGKATFKKVDSGWVLVHEELGPGTTLQN